jgi:methionyl-tRNA formyltransferase
MKVLLAGQKVFGAAALELLLHLGHEVVAVFAPPPKGDKVDRLASQALAFGIQPQSGLTADKVPPGTDLIVTAHSHDYITSEALQRTTYGGIGYHPSLLPLHRGKDAIRWAIRMGDKVTGGTVYWLSDHVDGGPIAAQDWCFVRPGDDAMALWQRELAPMGLRLFRRALTDISSGNIVRIPQDESLATWEPSLDRPKLASAKP